MLVKFAREVIRPWSGHSGKSLNHDLFLKPTPEPKMVPQCSRTERCAAEAAEVEVTLALAAATRA